MFRIRSIVSAARGKVRRRQGVFAGFMLLGSSSVLLLSGCGVNGSALSSMDPADSRGVSLQGSVYGGQRPVAGASIALYAAGTSGYGSTPASLLTNPVTTDSLGNFTITGDYTCPTVAGGSQVYIVATGGDPGNAGGVVNPNLSMMSALGNCPSNGTLSSSLFISINEVSTVASAYALAPFMTYPGSDATSPAPGAVPNVGTSSGNGLGLANAFATVNNLVNISTGKALSVTPAYAGNVNTANTSYVPQARINTLANVLAACVNSTGGSVGDGAGAGGDDSSCGQLFDVTTPSATGVPPTDTLQAILNLAQRPGLATAANNTFFGLSTGVGAPFQPTLSSAPGDWALALGFTGGGLGAVTGGVANTSRATSIAVDASGNLWVTSGRPQGSNTTTGLVAAFNNQGVPLSPATTGTTLGGYQSAGVSIPQSLAIDSTGNIWVGNGNASISVMNQSGAQVLSPLTGSGLLTSVRGLAFDTSGNIWAGSGGATGCTGGFGALAGFTSGGALFTPAGGYTNGAFYCSLAHVAFDPAGSLWAVDIGYGDLYQTNASNGALTHEYASSLLDVAIDSSGNAFSMASSGGINQQNGSSPNSTKIPQSRSGNVLTLDGLGSVWVAGPSQAASSGAGFLDAWSSGGSRLSPATTGYTGAGGGGEPAAVLAPRGGTAGVYATPGIAVDGSGNIWVLNAVDPTVGINSLVEFVGMGAPVVTPTSAALTSSHLATRP